MKTRSYKTLAVPVLLAAFVAVSAGQTPPAANAPPPSKLAVVNIVTLFDELHEKADADHAIEKLKTDLTTEITKRHDAITKLQSEIDDPQLFKRGSQEYLNEQDQLLQKTREFQAYQQYADDKVQMELRLRTVELYRKINDAVAAYSQANGIALVFVADSVDLGDAKSQDQLMQLIFTRKLLYFSSIFDITANIRNKMNGEYDLGKQKSAP